MKKLYIEKTESLYLVHTIDYSIAIWCTTYRIQNISSNKKYVSMNFGDNYLGTIDCEEVQEEF